MQQLVKVSPCIAPFSWLLPIKTYSSNGIDHQWVLWLVLGQTIADGWLVQTLIIKNLILLHQFQLLLPWLSFVIYLNNTREMGVLAVKAYVALNSCVNFVDLSVWPMVNSLLFAGEYTRQWWCVSRVSKVTFSDGKCHGDTEDITRWDSGISYMS